MCGYSLHAHTETRLEARLLPGPFLQFQNRSCKANPKKEEPKINTQEPKLMNSKAPGPAIGPPKTGQLFELLHHRGPITQRQKHYHGRSAKGLANAQMPVVEHIWAVSSCWETWLEWHELCYGRFPFPSNKGSSAVHGGNPLCSRMAIRARDAFIASHAPMANPRWWIFRTWSFACSAKGPGQGTCLTQPGPVALAGHYNQTQADRLPIIVDEDPMHHCRLQVLHQMLQGVKQKAFIVSIAFFHCSERKVPCDFWGAKKVEALVQVLHLLWNSGSCLARASAKHWLPTD